MIEQGAGLAFSPRKGNPATSPPLLRRRRRRRRRAPTWPPAGRAAASIVEQGTGWRHAHVDSSGVADTHHSSSDIGGVENKQDTHAHLAALLAARACCIHAAQISLAWQADRVCDSES